MTYKRKGEELKTPVAKAKKVDISWVGGLTTPATFSAGADTYPMTTTAPPSSRGDPSTPWPAMRSPAPGTNVLSSPLQRFAVPENFVPSSPQASPPTRARPAPTFIGAEQQKKAVRKALGLAETAAVAYKSPEQEEALERILNGLDSALAVVLPTGGGKTLLFTAPACLDDPGMTIVVVPYRQLMDETVADARGRGIDALEWSHDLQDPADIVFVIADKLNNTFFDYAARMTGKGLVRRVFVDERHLAVTAHSWRPKMVSLARLRCIEAPTIMLTATLPLHIEADLEANMLCELSLTLIRACTARRATKYIVRAGVDGGKLMEEAIEVCKKRLARLQNKAKMVVYCRSKGECEQLAEALGCNFFFSGSADNEDVIKGFLIYCKQHMKAELWDAESIGGLGEDEHWHEGGEWPVQSAADSDLMGSSDIFGESTVGNGDGVDASGGVGSGRTTTKEFWWLLSQSVLAVVHVISREQSAIGKSQG
jgi:hypothetical protein